MDIYSFRQKKDAFFANDPHSPVEGAFTGLRYFPVSPKFIVSPQVETFAESETVDLVTSVGDAESYLRFGIATFVLENEEQRLTLFLPANGGERLFIPFRDTTSGSETYGAGRYLDVPLKDKIRLDFNYAYNPYCSYSDRYRCPLPPKENKLTVAVRAGEKQYKKEANADT